MPKPGRRRSTSALREDAGQSTVEYALVLGAFLAMVLALGAIFKAAETGVVVEQAQEAASHSLGISMLGALQDAVLY